MAYESTKLTLPVEGMTCGHCVRTVTEALERIPGVRSARVDLSAKTATVERTDPGVKYDALKQAIVAAGYSVPDSAKDRIDRLDRPSSPPPAGLVTLEPPAPRAPAEEHPEHKSDRSVEEAWDLAIGGMHCASCVVRVENALKSVPGVREARVNLATETARVVIDPGRAGEPAIAAAVGAAGYSAKRAADDPAAAAAEMRLNRSLEIAFWRRRLYLGIGLTVPLVVLAYAPWRHATWLGWAMLPLATALQVYLGGPYVASAFQLAKQKSTNMDTLIALGTTAAYGYSLLHLFMDAIPQRRGLALILAALATAVVDAAGAMVFRLRQAGAAIGHQH